MATLILNTIIVLGQYITCMRRWAWPSNVTYIIFQVMFRNEADIQK